MKPLLEKKNYHFDQWAGCHDDSCLHVWKEKYFGYSRGEDILFSKQYKYVIRQPGGPYWEKLCPRARVSLGRYSRQRAQFFQTGTDFGWWITFLFSPKLNGIISERNEWFKAIITARSSINQTVSEWVNDKVKCLNSVLSNKIKIDFFGFWRWEVTLK